jgi:hypothetical protein
MANPAPSRSPPTKANPPSAHCVKPTKHMANYVAADGDFATPFDAIKNAVLPCNISIIYAATSNHLTNSYSTAETNTCTPKKSTNKAPGDFQRARTALTPEQESAEISRFLALVEQERIQDNKTRVTYACNSSNEAGSTEMGRSHSISIANGATNDIAAAELKNDNDDDKRNNSSSTSLPRQEDSLLASNERSIKKQRVSFDNTITIIKNKDNKSQNATLSRTRRLTPKTSPTTRGVPF